MVRAMEKGDSWANNKGKDERSAYNSRGPAPTIAKAQHTSVTTPVPSSCVMPTPSTFDQASCITAKQHKNSKKPIYQQISSYIVSWWGGRLWSISWWLGGRLSLLWPGKQRQEWGLDRNHIYSWCSKWKYWTEWRYIPSRHSSPIRMVRWHWFYAIPSSFW